MLVDKFTEFLKSLDNFDAPYIDEYGKDIIVDGHIPKDKLEEFLKQVRKGE